MDIPVNARSAIVLVSGGMDSVTLAHLLQRQVSRLHFLTFDYGQRHGKELEHAKWHAQFLNADFEVANIRSIQSLLTGSALTSPEIEVPEGHYAADTMKATVVPNRNMIMLAIAAGYAVSLKLDIVAAAVHAGDHFIYPDCRPAFVEAVRLSILLGNEGFGEPFLYTPFVKKTKADIVTIGAELEVQYVNTWSCYKGGPIHCGKCGTCVERKEAFELASVTDPTTYAA